MRGVLGSWRKGPRSLPCGRSGLGGHPDLRRGGGDDQRCTTRYVFYTADSYTAPHWPEDELVFLLDLAFGDIEAAEQRLIGLGATKPAHQPGGKHWTVLLDPSGQPFRISAAGKSR
ncbi:VOC family protein [Streptomyces sp. NPDC002209]|uniref:VOC family protein n=1 Tax=Streptomyces sp. NPDC002209 TaxID=3364638 RepID=UPI0036C4C82C